MGLMSKLVKGAVAERLIAEARKPQNQAKAKRLAQQVMAKRRGGGAPRG